MARVSQIVNAARKKPKVLSELIEGDCEKAVAEDRLANFIERF